MRRHLIALVGYSFMVIASTLALILNILTLIKLNPENAFWDFIRILLFTIVFGLLSMASIYLLIVNVLRWIQDKKIKKE
ncbi:MAG: hypothetical protein EOM23_07520 [Candidatus Moranbacteria bacterium]|nr:hypothetical protein [Candidatus Moranbacteria bacterium]